MTSRNAWDDGDSEQDGAAEQAFKPLTREQAQAWRATQPGLSPGRVVAAQAGAGLVAVLVAAAWAGAVAGWSALYGAVAIVVPSALMAWGISRHRPARPDRGMVLGFLIWELMKIGLVVGLLVAAPWVLKPVHWPALLGAMVLCLKVNWLALLRWGGSTRTSEAKE